MISLSQISKSFDDGRTYVVHQLSLAVEEGELLILLGESGSGKTTTLKMINRLVEPSSGTIEVAGTNIRDQDPVLLRRQIGYSFQGAGLFPHMTVAENIGVVPNLLGWSRQEIAERVDELMTLVNLDPGQFRERKPSELSGGQRQRVGVARALAARPKIMLMDEPFGALDPITRDTLQYEYTRIHRELGLTTVLVTHDMIEALLMADRIAVLLEGKIVQLGSPAQLLREPEHDYVRELMEKPLKQAQTVQRLTAEDQEDAA